MHFILIKNKARNKIAISREEERQQGKEEGLAEGLEKGKEEGEHNAKIETAKNMLKDGLPKEVVAKYTGLSVEDVKKLQ